MINQDEGRARQCLRKYNAAPDQNAKALLERWKAKAWKVVEYKKGLRNPIIEGTLGFLFLLIVVAVYTVAMVSGLYWTQVIAKYIIVTVILGSGLLTMRAAGKRVGIEWFIKYANYRKLTFVLMAAGALLVLAADLFLFFA
ncbi:hypothetical protein [Paenibacillus sp. Y412MC10]|uniref:hypothetical protein n=1 Tax=Geobacillus sp. (strain Y412MC10) TaxID=481743 RepID=UPI0011A5C26D|nr:hypothetical protein [Paenibacillus sp. Y412MC10]